MGGGKKLKLICDIQLVPFHSSFFPSHAYFWDTSYWCLQVAKKSGAEEYKTLIWCFSHCPVMLAGYGGLRVTVILITDVK